MTLLADTSVFIRLEGGSHSDLAFEEEVAVSSVTVGELSLGVLLASDVESRARRMATLEFAKVLSPLPVDDDVATEWARIVAALREAGRRMPLNDSWIAATAAAHGFKVLTFDSDFRDVPGVQVFDLGETER